jgi:hypothetical protein
VALRYKKLVDRILDSKKSALFEVYHRWLSEGDGHEKPRPYEDLLVGDIVVHKVSGASGRVDSVSSDGQVHVIFDDGTSMVTNRYNLELK